MTFTTLLLDSLFSSLLFFLQDRAGNAAYSFVQPYAALRPTLLASGINGRPALQFVGVSSQTMTMSTNCPAPCSVFYVARQLNTNNGRILSGLNNNWLLGWHGGLMDRA